MIRHTGIQVKDIEIAKEFYQSFGLSIVTHTIERWGPKRLEIVKLRDKDNKILELIECRHWPSHIAFQVDSISDYEDLRLGPSNSNKQHNVQYVQDPWGNWLELVEVNKE